MHQTKMCETWLQSGLMLYSCICRLKSTKMTQARAISDQAGSSNAEKAEYLHQSNDAFGQCTGCKRKVVSGWLRLRARSLLELPRLPQTNSTHCPSPSRACLDLQRQAGQAWCVASRTLVHHRVFYIYRCTTLTVEQHTGVLRAQPCQLVFR